MAAVALSCTRPLRAHKVDGHISFLKEHTWEPDMFLLPCGQCLDCRLRRKRDWALRIMHEASLHEQNCFLTLTYDDEHLPEDRSLSKRHWQLFCKKLRKRGYKFRYFCAGEYGDETLRPHYHACIFGYDFHLDREYLKHINGFPYYISPLLSDVWNFGFHSIGNLTFDSAAYVAKYVTKRVTGKKAIEDKTYERVDPTTGEVWEVLPEFSVMSRGGRPSKNGEKNGGIGKKWFDKYREEVYASDDFVVSEGRIFRPPRYYDQLLNREEPERYERLSAGRRERCFRQDAGDRERNDRAREAHTRARMALNGSA